MWICIILLGLAGCSHNGQAIPQTRSNLSISTIASAQHIDYAFVAHPDDEMEGWAAIQNDPQAYPVIVLLTRGENTSFCNTASYNLGYQPALKELPAIPLPTAQGTATCAQARIDSFNAFLDDFASVDPAHLDVIGNIAPISGNGPPLPATCSANSTSYWLWIGAHHARLVLNVGDGKVQPCAVVWALQVARSILPLLPVQTELNAVGDSYYAPPTVCTGSIVYTHPDHGAIYTALRSIALGVPGQQYQLVCAADGANAVMTLPSATQSFLFPSISGAIERHYGWLTVSPTPPPKTCCYPFQTSYYEDFAVRPSGATPTPAPSPTPATSAYKNVLLSLSPVQYFRFDELQGPPAHDSSATANNGTYFGSVVFGSAGPLLNEPSRAITLLGGSSNSGVKLPNPELGPGSSYSIETWVRPLLGPSYTTIWGYDGVHRLLLSSGGLLYSSFGAAFTSKHALSTNQWHDVVFVYNATIRLESYYIDGALDNTAALSPANAAFTSTYTVGEYTSSGVYPWSGSLAEHAVFKTALTSQQIQQLYTAAGY